MNFCNRKLINPKYKIKKRVKEKEKETSETATAVEKFLELRLWSDVVVGLFLVESEEVTLYGSFRHVWSENLRSREERGFEMKRGAREREEVMNDKKMEFSCEFLKCVVSVLI